MTSSTVLLLQYDLRMAIGFSKPSNLFGYTKYLNLNLVSYDPELI